MIYNVIYIKFYTVSSLMFLKLLFIDGAPDKFIVNLKQLKKKNLLAPLIIMTLYIYTALTISFLNMDQNTYLSGVAYLALYHFIGSFALFQIVIAAKILYPYFEGSLDDGEKETISDK